MVNHNSPFKAVFIALLMFCTAMSVQARDYVLNNFLPPAHFMRAVMVEWAEDVEEATEGRVAFTIPSGSLAPPPQQVNAVRSGVADAALIANIFLANQAPELSMSSLPFLINDAEAASVANWRSYERFLSEKDPLGELGVVMLSTFNFSGAYLYSLSDSNVNSVDELKDMRLWALPGTAAETLKNLGVSPVTSPAVQVSETVSKGVVDAFYGISPESVIDFKASAYTQAIIQFPLTATSTSFSFFVNERAWRRISAEDKATIRELSGEALARKAGIAAQAASDNAMMQMEAEGIALYYNDGDLYEELRASAQPLYDRFYEQMSEAGLDGPAMLEYFQQEFSNYD